MPVIRLVLQTQLTRHLMRVVTSYPMYMMDDITSTDEVNVSQLKKISRLEYTK